MKREKLNAKEGRFNTLFGKALLLFAAAASVMLCINPRIAHAYASLPMGSEADGYEIDADGNMTIYSDEGLENWLDAIGGGPDTYKVMVKTLTVNEGVTVIEDLGGYGFSRDMPFYGCTKLTTVSLPASLTEIGDESFRLCGSLTTVTIAEPSNLTTIGESAFEWDEALTTINIPESVTTIGSSAFYRCDVLELDAATLPSGLTDINDSIFYGCAAMTGRLTIPAGVTSIGESAFNGTGLTSVTIPAGVTSIGESAFNICNALTSVTIEDGVTQIGVSAFRHCEKLPSVTIPASVTSIGENAFLNCERLASVTMLGETPATLGDGGGSDNVFKGTGLSIYDKQIYVPKSSIMTYKESWTQWKEYINDGGSAGNDDPAEEDYADTSIDVKGFTKDATVYSVDVEWGAMTFQYENTKWDATNHMSGEGAGWRVYDSVNNEALDTRIHAINQIQVTNHSNAGVWATLAYAGAEGYTDTSGSFEKDAEDADTEYNETKKALILATADNGTAGAAGTPTVGTVYFMPSGIKEDYKTSGIEKWAQLGTITVSILTEEP